MKFAVEQKYEAPPEDVLAAYADPTTWEQLGPFSRVNIVEVLDSAGTPERPVLRIRYRFIADLPAVTESAPLSTKAQQCSLMMDANNALSHMPPTTWMC